MHPAFMCKLNRVIDQINDDLTDPDRISHQRPRNSRINRPDKIYALIARQDHQPLAYILNNVRHIDLNFLDHHLACLGAGEVQNIIEQAQ